VGVVRIELTGENKKKKTIFISVMPILLKVEDKKQTLNINLRQNLLINQEIWSVKCRPFNIALKTFRLSSW